MFCSPQQGECIVVVLLEMLEYEKPGVTGQIRKGQIWAIGLTNREPV